MTSRRPKLLTSTAPVRAPEDDHRLNRRDERADRSRPDDRADQRREDDHRARGHRDRPRRHHRDDEVDGDDDGDDDESIGDLVPDTEVAREFHISLMGLWRWSQDETLDFPAPISIRKRNYRSRKALEAFKKKMIDRAIRQRHRLRAAEVRS